MGPVLAAFTKIILLVTVAVFLPAVPGSAYTAALADPAWDIAKKIERLEKRLRNPDPFVRVEAAQALGEIPGGKTVNLLIEALSDDAFYVRAYAAEALGKKMDTRTYAPLLSAIADDEAYVRAFALEALGELGDLRAVDPLIAFLQSGREDSRAFAAWALGEIGDVRAVPPLIEALKSETTCRQATEALRRITGCDLAADYSAWRTWFDLSLGSP